MEGKAGRTDMERERVWMSKEFGVCTGRRGGERLPGPLSCKASCALGSLDFILRARGFRGKVSRRGKKDNFMPLFARD